MQNFKKMITKNSLLMSLCLALTASSAFGATFTVTRTDDRNAVCASGVDCSFREAVAAAESGDTVAFDSAVFSSPKTINFTGQFLIQKDLTIAGPGAVFLTLASKRDSAETSNRVFQIDAGYTVNISGMTLSNGKDQELGGGGIYNTGNLTLNDVIVENNFARVGDGGGILNDGGVLVLNNSTISGNMTTSNGGGIVNLNTGIITVFNSTIDHNSASNAGGGIHNFKSELSLINSTVSGNIANGDLTGGGIDNQGKVDLVNVTISNNQVTSMDPGNAGGFLQNGSEANVRNTIIAGNKVIGGNDDISGGFNSLGSNLIGKSDGTNGFFDCVNGDKVGTPNDPVDAMLDALGNYGGKTQTHRLQSASPAVNSASDCVMSMTCDSNNLPFELMTDQGGSARNYGGGVDMGAVEMIVPEISAPYRARTFSSGKFQKR